MATECAEKHAARRVLLLQMERLSIRYYYLTLKMICSRDEIHTVVFVRHFKLTMLGSQTKATIDHRISSTLCKSSCVV